MVMVAKNQNRLVERPEPAQSAFVPYSFPAGERIANSQLVLQQKGFAGNS